MNRRQFLSVGLALAGGALGLRPHKARGNEHKKKTTRLALLSDTHIPADRDNRYRGFYPYQNTRTAVDQIAGDLPDGIVITGDLSRLRGNKESYTAARKLLAPIADRRPIHVAIGNHDHRENFLRAFGSSEGEVGHVGGRHVVVANGGPVRLILLDSLLWVNLFPGQLGGAQRRWLQSYLRVCDDTPTILFFHHTIHCGANDLMDAGSLLNIITPARKVKAVVFGHSHACNFSAHKGIHLINLPAVGYTFSDRQPVGWVDALLTRDGGEFTVHAIGGNRQPDGLVKCLQWRT